MFKYKSTPLVLLIIFIFFFIFAYFVFKTSSKENVINEKLIKNNIEFSGIITNLNISDNHGFGIMRLKIKKANTKKFNPFISNKLFPFAIKDTIAEIYDFIPSDLKKGYIVEINSNTKTISFYDNEKFLYKWEISMIVSETDKNFIVKNTILK